MTQWLRNAGVLFAGLLVACSPSVKEAPEFAELCGQRGPVQILALADDEVAVGQVSLPVEFEGRWLYPIRQFDRPVLDAVAAGWAAAGRGFSQVGGRLESIEPCGGDRRVIAEGLDEIFVPVDAEGPWLGTAQEATDLSTFDPTGSAAPRHLAGIERFRFSAQGRDVFMQRTAEGDLARVTVSADVLEWRVLVDDVIQTSLPFVRARAEAPHRSAVALRADGALVGVDLRTDDVVPLASGVGWFSASWDADARWVAFGPGPSDELPTVGWLLDRATGQLRTLDSGDGSAFEVRLWGDVLSVERVAEDGQSSTEFSWLPDGPTLSLDSSHLFVVSGDARQLWLTDLSGGDLSNVVYGLVEGEPRRLAGPFPLGGFSDDGLWYRDSSAYSPSGEDPGPYDLVHVPTGTLQPRVVQRRVWSDVSLPGDRWVRIAPESVDDVRLGRLQIVDGPTGDTTTLDEAVSVDFFWLRPHTESWPQPWQTEDFVYGVRDPEGGRTGLWRVALSADE